MKEATNNEVAKKEESARFPFVPEEGGNDADYFQDKSI